MYGYPRLTILLNKQFNFKVKTFTNVDLKVMQFILALQIR